MRRVLAAVASLAAAAVLLSACSSSSSSPTDPAGAAGEASTKLQTIRMTSSTGQPEVLLRPGGTVTGLVVFMHGLDADENQILTDGFSGVRGALLDAGYAIVASDAHGDNTGNPASVRDQRNAVADARRRLGHVPRVDILAFSMGGFDALLTAASHGVDGLQAVALISPAVDQRVFLGGPLTEVVTAAFGHPLPKQVPGILKRSDPLLQPVRHYAGYRYHFWHSPHDTTVPVAQSTVMSSYLATGGIYAPVSALTGDHGNLTALEPRSLVRFFAGRTTA